MCTLKTTPVVRFDAVGGDSEAFPLEIQELTD
jgi:hypothetical protein